MGSLAAPYPTSFWGGFRTVCKWGMLRLSGQHPPAPRSHCGIVVRKAPGAGYPSLGTRIVAIQAVEPKPLQSQASVIFGCQWRNFMVEISDCRPNNMWVSELRGQSLRVEWPLPCSSLRSTTRWHSPRDVAPDGRRTSQRPLMKSGGGDGPTVEPSPPAEAADGPCKHCGRGRLPSQSRKSSLNLSIWCMRSCRIATIPISPSDSRRQ